MPLVSPGASGGFLGAADGVFLKVGGLAFRPAGFKRLGGLAAEVHHALRARPARQSWPGSAGAAGRVPSLAPDRPENCRKPFPPPPCGRASVLDLGQVSHRLDEGLDVFPAAAAGRVSDFSRGRPAGVPVEAGDDLERRRAFAAVSVGKVTRGDGMRLTPTISWPTESFRMTIASRQYWENTDRRPSSETLRHRPRRFHRADRRRRRTGARESAHGARVHAGDAPLGLAGSLRRDPGPPDS